MPPQFCDGSVQSILLQGYCRSCLLRFGQFCHFKDRAQKHIQSCFNMEEPEALKLKEKVGLSDEEVMQIIRCGRGQGLLCAGKNRIAVEIRSSQTQYDLITTNRADLEKREIK